MAFSYDSCILCVLFCFWRALKYGFLNHSYHARVLLFYFNTAYNIINCLDQEPVIRKICPIF